MTSFFDLAYSPINETYKQRIQNPIKQNKKWTGIRTIKNEPIFINKILRINRIKHNQK